MKPLTTFKQNHIFLPFCQKWIGFCQTFFKSKKDLCLLPAVDDYEAILFLAENWLSPHNIAIILLNVPKNFLFNTYYVVYKELCYT